LIGVHVILFSLCYKSSNMRTDQNIFTKRTEQTWKLKG